MKKINFVFTSTNYTGVQSQLSGLIDKHFDTNEVELSYGKYLDGAINISFFIKKRAEILMSHGVADKNYFFRKKPEGGRYLEEFKHGFVPGQRLKQRILDHKYVHMPEENIHVVGWPRMDYLLELQKKLAPETAEQKANRKLKVLWAPTHDFNPGSSYPVFEQYLPALKEKFDVEVSLHPRNRESKKPTAECLVEADVIISDFGTMVYEALALGKPVLFPDWLIRDDVLERYAGRKNAGPAVLFNDDIGIHSKSFDDMMDTLIAGPVIDARTKAFADSVISPDTFGKSGLLAAQAALKIYQQEKES